jgi:hypothetical protein
MKIQKALTTRQILLARNLAMHPANTLEKIVQKIGAAPSQTTSVWRWIRACNAIDARIYEYRKTGNLDVLNLGEAIALVSSEGTSIYDRLRDRGIFPPLEPIVSTPEGAENADATKK